MAEHTTSILDKYPAYEATIGIEVHVQLMTNSKIFCSCANTVAKDPNSHICPICAGYPGTMPMLNKKVVDFAILAGLATNCTINQQSTFDRKHYFYPDLPKNFQITQQAEPICTEGHIPIRLEDGSTKNIRLIRIHIEEDAGKNIHSSYSNESFVDLNRAGTPLLEIVSYPDISSTQQVRTYLKTLRSIVQYLGICTGNMDEGSFRADTNISVRKKGQKELGTKCELKNINSFKFISDATEHELERQIEILEAGDKVRSETRLWDSKAKTTIMMRSKEETADYRFFQEPDLPIISIDDARLEKAKLSMPELPLAKFERFTKQLGLSEYEADILIEDIDLANYFDAAKKHTNNPSLIHWILRDLMGYIKEEKISLPECKVTPARLAQIVDLVEQGVINGPTAKEVFVFVAQTDKEPMTIIEEKGLKQIGSADELETMVKEVIAANPKQTEEYRSGKDKLFGFFVGQMMQKTKGKGNPQLINDLIKKHLLSLFLLCSISYVYHVQSMEIVPQQQTDSSSEQLYSINNNTPRFEKTNCIQCNKTITTKDNLSEKLYNYDLTANKIKELVKQGADVNYKSPKLHAIPLHFALNTTEHAVENMKTIIEFGAQLDNIPYEYHSPLTISVQNNHTPMIALLLPYEKDKSRTYQEQQKRTALIYKLLTHRNFESIKLFLNLSLVDVNQIFYTFIQYGKPNKEFLNYLIDNGASDYNSDYNYALSKTIKQAFPDSNNNHIQMTSDLADCGAFNSWGLLEICKLEKRIIAIREQLEKNKPSNPSEK